MLITWRGCAIYIPDTCTLGSDEHVPKAIDVGAGARGEERGVNLATL